MYIYIIMVVKMIKYEIKKICGSKSVLLLFSVLLILNIAYVLYSTYPEHHGTLYQGRKKILNIVEGPITQENYEFLIDNYNNTQNKIDEGDYNTETFDDETYSGYVFGDNQLFIDILESYKNSINYQNSIESVLKIADENIELTNDNDWRSYNRKLLEKYEIRGISYFYDYTLINNLIDNDFSYLLSLIMIIMITINIFLKEKQDGTFVYYKLVKNGVKRIFNPKIVTLTILCIIISISFSISKHLTYYVLGATKGWLQPLYALDKFKLTASSISILGYTIINSIVQIIGCIIFMLLLVLITKFLKNNYQGIILGLVLLVISIFLYNNRIFSVIEFSSIKELYLTYVKVGLLLVKGGMLVVSLYCIDYLLYRSRRLS